jgi:hypothetical protein
MYTIQILVLFSLYFWQFWGSDHRASFMQGRHSTTEQYPQPLNISFQCFFFFFFKSLPDYLLPAPNDSNWPRKEWGLPGHQHIGTEPLDPALQAHAWHILESLPGSITGTWKFCPSSKSLNLDAFQDELWVIFVLKTRRELEGTLLSYLLICMTELIFYNIKLVKITRS